MQHNHSCAIWVFNITPDIDTADIDCNYLLLFSGVTIAYVSEFDIMLNITSLQSASRSKQGRLTC